MPICSGEKVDSTFAWMPAYVQNREQALRGLIPDQLWSVEDRELSRLTGQNRPRCSTQEGVDHVSSGQAFAACACRSPFSMQATSAPAKPAKPQTVEATAGPAHQQPIATAVPTPAATAT